MIIIKPPNPFPMTGPALFLAGSIDMGAAENWQQHIESELKLFPGIILNPRRDDWDSSWVQSIENSQFREQVEWELDAMERATLIAMYFDPSTKSPISLLELGLWAKSGKMIVCCPNGFWRKGNVDILCSRYRVQQANDIQGFYAFVRQRLKDWARRRQPATMPLDSLVGGRHAKVRWSTGLWGEIVDAAP